VPSGGIRPATLASCLCHAHRLVKGRLRRSAENSPRRPHPSVSSMYSVRVWICFSVNHWRMACQRRLAISASSASARPLPSKSLVMGGS